MGGIWFLSQQELAISLTSCSLSTFIDCLIKKKNYLSLPFSHTYFSHTHTQTKLMQGGVCQSNIEAPWHSVLAAGTQSAESSRLTVMRWMLTVTDNSASSGCKRWNKQERLDWTLIHIIYICSNVKVIFVSYCFIDCGFFKTQHIWYHWVFLLFYFRYEAGCAAIGTYSTKKQQECVKHAKILLFISCLDNW